MEPIAIEKLEQTLAAPSLPYLGDILAFQVEVRLASDAFFHHLREPLLDPEGNLRLGQRVVRQLVRDGRVGVVLPREVEGEHGHTSIFGSHVHTPAGREVTAGIARREERVVRLLHASATSANAGMGTSPRIGASDRVSSASDRSAASRTLAPRFPSSGVRPSNRSALHAW
jgi:hypothetical protein